MNLVYAKLHKNCHVPNTVDTKTKEKDDKIKQLEAENK
jgi:hypothetical protein